MPLKEGYTKLTVLYKILKINKFFKNIGTKKPYIELDFPNKFNNFEDFVKEYYYESMYSQFVDKFSESEMRLNLPRLHYMYYMGFEWRKGCRSLIPTTLDDYEEYYLPYLPVLGGLPETKKVLEKLYKYYSSMLGTKDREEAFKKVKGFIKPTHKDHYVLYGL